MAEKSAKSKKGLIIAGIIGGVGCLAVFGLILLFCVFLFVPTFVNASEKAREGAVKANLSAAASTIVTKLAVDELPAPEAIDESIEELNRYKGKPYYSPFDKSIPGFGKDPAPGVVVFKAVGPKAVEITGYNKDVEVLATKTIEFPLK